MTDWTAASCRNDAGLWHAEYAGARVQAMALCLDCPLLMPCTEQREANLARGKSEWGVWAGKDMGMSTGTTRHRRDPKAVSDKALHALLARRTREGVA